MPFQALGLHEKVVSGILATGYTAPTEIQSLAIPLALEGRDIIGIAQTGTGKTAAFILPILNRLVASGRKAHTKHRPRALILTPTRELAIQADEFARDYGRFTDLRSLTVYGGVDIKKQIKALKKGVDLIAATPGRLIDHINQKNVDFSGIEVLVIDEADRMFDMGFIDDVMRIIRLLPLERQTFLFSATFSEEVQLLTEGIQQNPKIITVGRQQTPVESVTQHVFPVQQDRKLDLLLHILNEEKLDRVLVFSRTKHGADKISRRLERGGIKSIAIHANRSQSQRENALFGFKNGRFNVLVATDVAARGIDVEAISHVINFDVPRFAEDYIHRIGRTGRATASGDAFTFVSGDEEKFLSRIEKFIDIQLERKRYPTFNYKQKSAPPEDRKGRKSQKGKDARFDTHLRSQNPKFDHQPKAAHQDVSKGEMNQEELVREDQNVFLTKNSNLMKTEIQTSSLREYKEQEKKQKHFRSAFWDKKKKATTIESRDKRRDDRPRKRKWWQKKKNR